MRTPVPEGEAPVVDKRRPINKKELSGPECFGLEWAATDRMCILCAMYGLCQAKFQLHLDEQAVVLEKSSQAGMFLDRADFSLVPEEKLAEQLRKDSGKYTIQQFVETISYLAQTTESGAIIEWGKRFFKNHGFKSIDGIVWSNS